MTGFIQGDLPMINGPSFASLAYDNQKKRTRREKFLTEMDQVIPWADLLEIIRKHYPRAGNGRQPMPLERMLRIYFMQQWYGPSCRNTTGSLSSSVSSQSLVPDFDFWSMEVHL